MTLAIAPHTAHRPARDQVALRGLFLFGLSMSVLTQAVYNLLPRGVGDLFEMTMFGTAVLLFILMPFNRRLSAGVFLSYAALVILLLVSALMTDMDARARYYIRSVMMFVTFAVALWGPYLRIEREDLRGAYRITLIAGALVIAQALLFDPLIVGGKARLAPFAGGADGLHPSAYSAFGMLLLLLYVGRPAARRARALHWVICLGLAYVVVMYQVRTVYLLALVLGGLLLYKRGRVGKTGFFSTLSLMFALLIFAGMGILLQVVDANTLADISSGRTLAYGERLQLIAGRDWGELLFGTGAGSDFMRGQTRWLYEEKNSHNDILMVLIENGLFGFALIMFVLIGMAFRMPRTALVLYLAYLSTSLISNGLLMRPSAGGVYVFLFTLLFALENSKTKDQI